jgi:hypothetical protein
VTRIVLHIDRLVLNGFRRGDANGMADALKGELVRSLDGGAARAITARGDRSRLALEVPALRPTADATRVGALVGRRVARGLAS